MKIQLPKKQIAFILIAIGTIAMFFFSTAKAQNTWAQKADFGGTERFGAVGFSIGSKGYIGTGAFGNIIKKDFWEYNPFNDSWTQKADFGGTARFHAVGFSIGSKGYIGTGLNNGVYKKDFWEFDTTTNGWTQMADFGGTARNGAVGFSIGSKGYVGTGISFDGVFHYYSDFWEYDSTNDTWSQKTDFGGAARLGSVGFSIGSKGYVGTGYDGSNFYNDFWEYDITTNGWAQKANFGVTGKEFAVGFCIGNKGYIGTGWDGSNYYNDFWEYDPAINDWTQKADFGGMPNFGAAGFPIGNKGYIGLGVDSSYTIDFWEYAPDSIATSVNEIINSSTNVLLFPNPFSNLTTISYSLHQSENVFLKIYDVEGRLIRTLADESMSEGTHELTWDAHDENRNPVNAGIYFLKIEAPNFSQITKLLVTK